MNANHSGVPVDWDAILIPRLHETQLHIIESMRWIDRPLSAKQLFGVLGESVDVPAISYHMRRLRQARVVRRSWTKSTRGAKERFHRLSSSAPEPPGGQKRRSAAL